MIGYTVHSNRRVVCLRGKALTFWRHHFLGGQVMVVMLVQSCQPDVHIRAWCRLRKVRVSNGDSA